MGKSRPTGSPAATSSLLSATVGANEGQVNAPVQTLRTSDTVATASAERHTGAAHRCTPLHVIATTSLWWLFAAAVTAAIALVSMAHDRVPLGSGVAVAVLTIAAIVDVRERRLPDIVVITAALALVICVALDSVIRQANPPLVSMVGGVAAFAGPLLVLHLIAPASMGFGVARHPLRAERSQRPRPRWAEGRSS